MKTNRYKDLINFGLSPKTLLSLTESEINILHKNLVEKKEEPKEYQDINTKIRRFSEPEVSKLKQTGESLPGGKAVKMNLDGSVDVTLEGEMTEEKEKSKNNPWAICHSQLGPKKTAKFERCVKQVKKSMRENKNPFDVILENKILSLVEKHLNPKITKSELMSLLEKKTVGLPIGKLSTISMKEDKTKEKEVPTKKPGTKTPSKPKKDDPFRPSPHKQPNPKAKKEETKESVMSSPVTKPKVKPGTKTPPKPKKGDPFRPDPSKQPGPKARGRKLPDWLKFNTLGIKLKGQ